MGYAVQIKCHVPFMQALVDALAGNAFLSLEGDLSRCADAIAAIPGASDRETACLRHNTLAPPHDFVVLPLERETQASMVRHILPRVGLHRRVWHVCIEKAGTVQFAAFDNFAAPYVGNAVPEDLLATLVERGVLTGYQRIEETLIASNEG